MSAGSAACRVADSPVGTLVAHSFHARKHGPPHRAVVQGLEVSRGDVLQHQLVQAKVRYQPLQLRVFLLKLLEPSRLIHLQPAILLAPAVVRLLCNQSFFTCLGRCLPVRHSNFDLTKQAHYLFWRMLLSSCHSKLPSYQFLAHQLVQKAPDIPPSVA